MNTYVYDGNEVKKTGREAIRTIGSRKHTLVEITPVDTSLDWKKWVDPSMLFVVQPPKQTER